MMILPVKSQKNFDALMQGIKKKLVTLVQQDEGVFFMPEVGPKYYIDFVNFYNFFDEKKHGKDVITWKK